MLFKKKYIGLYRDDGPGIFRNMSGPEVERKKKKIWLGYLKVMDCLLQLKQTESCWRPWYSFWDSFYTGHLSTMQETKWRAFIH